MTVSLFVQHQVKDFAKWKKFYDENSREVLEAGGVLAATVHRNLDDPNSVLVYSQFANADAAKAFINRLNSDESREVSAVSGSIMESLNIWAGEDV